MEVRKGKIDKRKLNECYEELIWVFLLGLRGKIMSECRRWYCRFSLMVICVFEIEISKFGIKVIIKE